MTQWNRNSFLSFSSGILYALCFPKFDLAWLLGWVCLIPLFEALKRSQTSRQAFLRAWLAGFTANAVTLYWVVVTVKMGGGHWILALAAWLALAATLAVFWGFFGLYFYFLFLPTTYYLLPTFFLSCAWVAFEYLRSAPWTLMGGFPWCLLGHSLIQTHPFAQLAELGGVPLLSFFLVFVQLNFWNFKKRGFIIATLAIAAVFPWCQWRYFKVKRSLEPTLKVAILQGNIYQYDKWDDQKANSIIAVYRKLTEEANLLKPDLVVYPETFYPHTLPFLSLRTLIAENGFSAGESRGINYLLGMAVESDQRFFNSALLVQNQKIQGLYSKAHLVPFGEYLPLKKLIFPLLRVFMNLEEAPILIATGEVTPGHEIKPLEIILNTSANPTLHSPRSTLPKAGVSICYESIFPEIARVLKQKGATMLVNLTNDGWYLDTAAPYQHFLMNIARSIETRLPLIRAANTGISAIVNPLGEVSQRTKLNEQILLFGSIEESQGLSRGAFLSVLPMSFPWFCLFLTIAMAVIMGTQVLFVFDFSTVTVTFRIKK